MLDFDRLLIGPCMQAFGQSVIFTRQGQASVAISGVFDRAYLQQQPLGGGAQEPARSGASGNIVAARPVLGVQLSQFGGAPPKKGDGIMIPAEELSFTVQECRPDGKGWALLMLTKA